MVRSWLLALLVALVVSLASVDGLAARRIRWTRVEAPTAEGARQVTRALRRRLVTDSRHAKWGKGPRLELSATVETLSWTAQQDVLRISMTVVARIAGGKGARSHIRLGGRLTERRKLLRQALRIVSSGLVTRLAEIARASGSGR